ncbi:phosphohydrolase [Candidatus Magnetomorum sp. HK-1]|nr:phosphohydrolase [Candidatus Magnetomorum sp. HK-1]
MIDLLNIYYSKDKEPYERLIIHSKQVAEKALECAKMLDIPDINLKFIWEAAMLHDIGIFMVHAPQIGCKGNAPYVCHGYLGMQLLEKKGLHQHARVCARHVGVGLSPKDIREQKIPIPEIDMRPETLEEQIICYADKFYSKNGSFDEKSITTIEKDLLRYNPKSVDIFRQWHERFSFINNNKKL